MPGFGSLTSSSRELEAEDDSRNAKTGVRPGALFVEEIKSTGHAGHCCIVPLESPLLKSLITESKSVLLDFNGVTAIDSSGIGVIVGLMVSAKKSDCKLKFVNLTPRVEQIFTRNRVFEALRYLGVSD